MEKDNQNKLLDALRANLVAPIKKDLQSHHERISSLENEVKKLRQKLLILIVVIVVGVCLHLWLG